ncbi:unnamed protein product [Meganyctiphanes norvegica]|uniref:Uncharacterized protein n=1 Tax=Meganyctiphanes norvegica TaxID=48144 RepID=A0AAV2SH15_MEGNR
MGVRSENHRQTSGHEDRPPKKRHLTFSPERRLGESQDIILPLRVRSNNEGLLTRQKTPSRRLQHHETAKEKAGRTTSRDHTADGDPHPGEKEDNNPHQRKTASTQSQNKNLHKISREN